MSSYNLQKPTDRARFRQDHADELAAVKAGTWPRDINEAFRWVHGSDPEHTGAYAARMCQSAIEYIDDLEARIVAQDPDLASYEPWTTNWRNIARKAGPNADVSDQPVYLFGSMARLDPSKSWLAQFRAEAEAHKFEVVTHGGHLYVVIPQPGEPS